MGKLEFKIHLKVNAEELNKALAAYSIALNKTKDAFLEMNKALIDLDKAVSTIETIEDTPKKKSWWCKFIEWLNRDYFLKLKNK